MPGVTSILMGARTVDQLTRNLESLKLTLEPAAMGLLCDAGNELLEKLGTNLDPYESADSTRIV
jgi:aryl-alcohol dehydrogenase-like predicted oxidoreductase